MKSVSVLFDLDGTLTDPREGFVSSITHALVSLGHCSPPEDELASNIGPPLEITLAKLLGEQHEHQIPEAVSLYRQRYSSQGLFENSVYDGIEGALSRVQASGARLFVATSKPQVFAVRILEHFGLQKFFTGIYGSGLDGSLTNKDELIAHILEKEALEPEAALMIGDRAHDVVGALANGICPVGVLWGYGSIEELSSAGAAVLVRSPEQLPDVLSSNPVFERAAPTPALWLRSACAVSRKDAD